MTAQLLREAAALMRSRAEAVFSDAASRDPWTATEAEGGNRDVRRTLGTFSLVHDGTSEVALVRGFSDERTATAEHIASWHPAVALAVAGWLDTAGADLWAHGPLCECGSGCLDCDDDLWQPHVRRALAVARAYLGRDT